MPRRGIVIRRALLPDPKYGSPTVTRLISKIMLQGKKVGAEKIVYGALDAAAKELKDDPAQVLDRAMKNATPLLKVKPRRVGGATYQIPVEVKPSEGSSLAMRWIIQAARARKGRPMAEKLAAELMDAAKGQGVAVKRREDTHRMAEANRAFVHYRW
ncbi:MAG: 30S ribosomal protein S7 [Chloroflexi bacterium]|nr:30S ribosomal protein S7 [Chloroflexota bacterium]